MSSVERTPLTLPSSPYKLIDVISCFTDLLQVTLHQSLFLFLAGVNLMVTLGMVFGVISVDVSDPRLLLPFNLNSLGQIQIEF